MAMTEKYVDYDRLSVLTGGLLLAMVLMRFLESPARRIVQATVLGSPLGIDLSAENLMPLIILGMSITAVTSMLQNHPVMVREGIGDRSMYWIVPALLNVSLALWLNQIESLQAWVIGLVACGILVPAALATEYHLVETGGRSTRAWQRVEMLLMHLAAVILFSLIYHARIRSLLSATAVALVGALLSSRLFWMSSRNAVLSLRYGGVTGLVLGQAVWGLNYWRLSGPQAGLLLLLLFYLLTGLTGQAIQGQLDDNQRRRKIVLEYGGVAAVVLLLVAMVGR